MDAPRLTAPIPPRQPGEHFAAWVVRRELIATYGDRADTDWRPDETFDEWLARVRREAGR